MMTMKTDENEQPFLRVRTKSGAVRKKKISWHRIVAALEKAGIKGLHEMVSNEIALMEPGDDELTLAHKVTASIADRLGKEIEIEPYDGPSLMNRIARATESKIPVRNRTRPVNPRLAKALKIVEQTMSHGCDDDGE